MCNGGHSFEGEYVHKMPIPYPRSQSFTAAIIACSFSALVVLQATIAAVKDWEQVYPFPSLVDMYVSLPRAHGLAICKTRLYTSTVHTTAKLTLSIFWSCTLSVASQLAAA